MGVTGVCDWEFILCMVCMILTLYCPPLAFFLPVASEQSENITLCPPAESLYQRVLEVN
jgi:hypothetical protein